MVKHVHVQAALRLMTSDIITLSAAFLNVTLFLQSHLF